MFSRPVSSGWKPVPTSSRLATRPSSLDPAAVGSVMRREDLEQRALAGAVAADDADHLAALDLEGDVLERPELLNAVALDDLPPARHIDGLAQVVLPVADKGVA